MGFSRHEKRKRSTELRSKNLYASCNLGTKRKVQERVVDMIRDIVDEKFWPTLINISLADSHGHALDETDRKLCAIWRTVESMVRNEMSKIRPDFLFADHVEVTYDLWFRCRCCKSEFNRVGTETPRVKGGYKVCRWCFKRCDSMRSSKYQGCESCSTYDPKGPQMSVFNYDRNPTEEARKLINKISDHYSSGDKFTAEELVKIAPAGCFTPRHRRISKSVINQLIRFDVIKKSGDDYIYIGSI